MKNFLLALIVLAGPMLPCQAEDVTFKIKKRYLNIPVSHQLDAKIMTLSVPGGEEHRFKVRLAAADEEYWVFYDVSEWKGKTLRLSYEGDDAGLKRITQDDRFAGQDSLYHETYRPQFHFSTRRGWNNDPNGLLFYEGEYHLFYQHNPFDKRWNNMHWGHAVSADLIHWKELPVALRPDKLGTMFSGSAVIDYENTAGFNKKDTPAMVAIYTANNSDRQTQCIAYSLDKGRTFTKYDGNPVIDSKEKWNSHDTRDPKVFWYAPGRHWVLVLHERDGHSIYNSSDLKHWTYKSHVTGFWECPELFELPVDGNPDRTKWVMYGASGVYMIGSFDGQQFTPESGKHCYFRGSMYAAQTYNNIPREDGRRIQIGWCSVFPEGMPFNCMMTLPTELTLRTTSNGVRLYSRPVREVEQLCHKVGEWKALTAEEATHFLKPFSNQGTLRIKTKIKLSHTVTAGLSLYGQDICNYDMVSSTINGEFYSPDDFTSMELSADIFIDKTTIEVFIDGGKYSYCIDRKAKAGNDRGFFFWGSCPVEVQELQVFTVDSSWTE